jgi:hypothetical protein
MSGQSGGGQVQGGQGGQGGQPQGGQPPGGPQGGPAAQGGGSDVLQEWGIYGTILFSLAGLGNGLLWFLFDTVDEQLLEASQSGAVGQQTGMGFGAAFMQLFMLMTPLVAIFVAPFVGAAIARQVEHGDSMVFKIVGVCSGAGTVVGFILSAFLISTTVSNASIAFGGLLINAIVAGVVAAGVGVGGVWAQRNQAPN